MKDFPRCGSTIEPTLLNRLLARLSHTSLCSDWIMEVKP